MACGEKPKADPRDEIDCRLIPRFVIPAHRSPAIPISHCLMNFAPQRAPTLFLLVQFKGKEFERSPPESRIDQEQRPRQRCDGLRAAKRPPLSWG